MNKKIAVHRSNYKILFRRHLEGNEEKAARSQGHCLAFIPAYIGNFITLLMHVRLAMQPAHMLGAKM